MTKIQGINDFVIRFANVNGTGSASANNLLAKAIFRMGIPVSPKNIFPSNIQGLPTWYEVRVSEQGYLGRRGGYDFVVAVNGQTMRGDYDNLLPGGYFLYDSSRALPENYQRDDITLIGIPMTEICNREISDPRLRRLLVNIVYIGALSYLLDIEFSVLSELIGNQYKKKPQLAEPNILALELGFSYAGEHYAGDCEIGVKRSDKLDDHIIMDGNSALALGALYGGATVAGWYPITPSTSIIETFSRFAGQYRKDDSGRNTAAIIQAEDELAALGIAIGACWNGARGFTATSGPGLSLMNEFLGLAYFAEIPVVVMDVQRVGPSTGMPTRTQQSDLLSAAYASHGDTRHVLLFPGDPTECFDMAADAFDLAEQLQTPVIIMSDLDLGMNDTVCLPPKWDDSRRYNRGKVLDGEMLEALKERWGRYHDIDGDGICYRTYPATHAELGAYVTRGSSHDEYAAYTEDSAAYERSMKRLGRKWLTARGLVPKPAITMHERNATYGIIYFGTSSPAALEAVDMLNNGSEKRYDTMRLRAFPFSEEAAAFIDSHEILFVVEQNRDAQMRKLLIDELEIDPQRLIAVLQFDGLPITAEHIRRGIEEALRAMAGNRQHPHQGGSK
jgi:2-oxoglutarate ferredoxin oxidoreductase subunit alpha